MEKRLLISLGGTGSGDTGLSVLWSGASDGSSARVDEWKSFAGQPTSALSDDKLAIDTLSESTIDTGVLAWCARRIGSEGGEFGVESNSVLTVGEFETSRGARASGLTGGRCSGFYGRRGGCRGWGWHGAGCGCWCWRWAGRRARRW